MHPRVLEGGRRGGEVRGGGWVEGVGEWEEGRRVGGEEGRRRGGGGVKRWRGGEGGWGYVKELHGRNEDNGRQRWREKGRGGRGREGRERREAESLSYLVDQHICFESVCQNSNSN